MYFFMLLFLSFCFIQIRANRCNDHDCRRLLQLHVQHFLTTTVTTAVQCRLLQYSSLSHSAHTDTTMKRQ